MDHSAKKVGQDGRAAGGQKARQQQDLKPTPWKATKPLPANFVSQVYPASGAAIAATASGLGKRPARELMGLPMQIIGTVYGTHPKNDKLPSGEQKIGFRLLADNTLEEADPAVAMEEEDGTAAGE